MKPANLLFFLSDNHARSALGCYGNPAVRTPVLDGLAAQGTRFANAYTASPLCCPARASKMSSWGKEFPSTTRIIPSAIPQANAQAASGKPQRRRVASKLAPTKTVSPADFIQKP